MKSFRTIILFLFFAVPLIATSQTRRPMQIEDLFRIQRVGDPQLSPDGKTLAYVVTVVNKNENTTNSDIWLLPMNGHTAKQLTNSPKQDRHPRWSPDGKWIAFESNRSGSMQIYVINAATGETKQVTDIATEASMPMWSPTGKSIAFISEVFPEYSEKPYSESNALNKAKLDQMENGKVKARLITKLLYRHWDHWVDGKRQHLFITTIDGTGTRDLTPGDRDAVPTSSTFSAGDDFGFSPDGNELAYTATPVPIHDESWSTNHDIYVVDIASGKRTQLTTNPAADVYPRYSPDGKYIAYRAQSQPGYESDRWQLMIYNRSTKATKSVTQSFDANVGTPIWSPDSKMLYFDAEEKANNPLWSVTLDGTVKKVVDNATNTGISISPDGSLLVFSHQTLSRPVEIYSSKSDGTGLTQLTHVNDDIFSHIEFSKPEYVWFTGATDTKVQMWIFKPPFFNPKKKYPFVYMIHGGPQGAWGNSWSFRWNPQLWAAQGYIIACPNPRGSTGFGHTFTAEISRDWGGKVYTDIMNGLAYMEQQTYIDTARMGAAGASYGGYMMNWLNGHTNKFKTIVCHDGVYNFDSMYGGTEETWFDEWEHGIPWETKDFDKFSPNKYAKDFNTPTLVIHNLKDFRVPFSEGMQLFTMLQRRGIPSELLSFPDEGHWVLKPLNSELWHKTVFGWLDRYLKK